MAIWNYPELGNFRFDDYCWAGTISIPAFKSFKYRWRARNAGCSKLTVQFSAESRGNLPSRRAVAVVNRIIKNQNKLVSLIKNSVWNDLHDSGPDSGMWWRGQLALNETINDPAGEMKSKRLETPEDLFDCMGSPSIWVQESIHGYPKPSTTIGFDAAFDVEHGLGIITDGSRILGIGYQADPSLF